MTSQLRNRLNRIGFSVREVEIIASLIDLNTNIELVSDNDLSDLEIEKLIRQQYSLSKELSILRKHAMGILDISIWNEYCEYVQECIDKIK